MLLGALCSHYFVPQVQRRPTPADIEMELKSGRSSVPQYVNIPLQDLPVRRRHRKVDADGVELGERNPA